LLYLAVYFELLTGLLEQEQPASSARLVEIVAAMAVGVVVLLVVQDKQYCF